MNIVLMPSAFFPSLGGVEELSKRLAYTLKEAGHEVLVVTERWPRSLPREEVRDGTRVLRLPFRVPCGVIKPKLSYALTTGLIRRSLCNSILKFKADILHVQCVSSNAHYAVIAKRKLRVPLVVTLQGELSMDAAGIYQRPGFAQSLMFRALQEADAITACSQQTLSEAENFYVSRGGALFSRRGRVIYNGVELSSFDNVIPHHHTRPYVFALGRHVPQKGFDILLRAMVQVAPNYDLLLAGDGPEREMLLELATELGIEKRVFFVGRLDSDKVRQYMKGATLFVLPSRHEPFGIVNLEAMACGTPVVATRVGGVPEFVENGRTGLLVDANNPEALASGIRNVLDDPKSAVKRARNATDLLSKFNWAHIGKSYAMLYAGLASKK